MFPPQLAGSRRLASLGVAVLAVLAPGCTSMIDGSDPGQDRGPMVVHGHTLGDTEAQWVAYVAREVLPHLPGSADARLDDASVVTWWSLKEGVLDLENPIVYSNCSTSSGDLHIGPFETCEPGRAWQVGLSGVQVEVASQAEIEARAGSVYGGDSLASILARTAVLAGVDADTVKSSTGSLRASWLLREPVIGFSFEQATIRSECVDRSERWCYGTAWDASELYAPDRATALDAIDEIRAILAARAPR